MRHFYFPSRVILADTVYEARQDYEDNASDHARQSEEITEEAAKAIEPNGASSLALLAAAKKMSKVIERADRRRGPFVTCLDVDTKEIEAAYFDLSLAIAKASSQS